VNSPLLNLLERTAGRVKSGQMAPSDAAQFLRRVIHGALLEGIVKDTPNPFDDLLLDWLRSVIPPPA
jgi:hypothetical protein